MTDERLNAVLAEYLEAEDAGCAPDRSEFIARHPDVATELEAFFANQDEFDSRAEPLGPARSVSRPRNGEPRRPFWLSPDEKSAPQRADAALPRFGDYELLEEIARGGMGVVYKARHVGLGRIVGLKMILAGPLASAADLERFRIEAHAAAMLDHPNLVPTYDVGECDGQPFFTMKFVEGRSLAERLAEWKDDPRAVARMIVKIARAVHYAHQRGVLHRDLKPANILIDTAGEPHVTDFGLAKCLDSQNELTQTGTVLGTPSYMAPEQAAGSRLPLTTGVDVYSLGAILYAMITGRPPFRAETPVETLRQVTEQEPESPSRINRHLDRDLETVCLKCLEKDQRGRYGSAEALADDLDRWVSHRPILARRASWLHRTSKWARRHPALAGLVTVTILAALATTAGTFWHSKRLEVEIERVKRERHQAQLNFDRAEAERDRAERREQEAQRHLFAAQMGMAQHAADAGQYGRAIRLLEPYRTRLEAADLRSFEWHYLWRLCRQGHERTIRSGTGPAQAVAFTPDGRSLLVGGADGRLRLHDPETGSVREVLEHSAESDSDDSIRSVAVSRDGRLAATLSHSGLRVWDLETLRELYSRAGGVHYTMTAGVAFSPDGTILAECTYPRTRLRDAQSGELVGTIAHLENALAFSEDGRQLAGVNSGRNVELWQIDDLKEPRVLGQHRTYVVSVALSPDGRLLASGSEDGIVKLWDLQRGEEVESIEREPGGVYGLAFSPDSTRLAWAGENGTVHVRELSSGDEKLHGHAGPVYALAFSRDGQRLATAAADGAHIWRLGSDAVSDELRGHEHNVFSVAISPDGRTIASGSRDKTVRLWNAATGELLDVLRDQKGMITAVAFSPDGRLLACGNARRTDEPIESSQGSGSVMLWNMVTGQLQKILPGHDDSTWGLAFAPDSRTLATSGYIDKTIKLWDVETGDCTSTLEGHPVRTFCVAISPDGRTIASGSASDSDDNRTVFLWDATTGKQKGSAFRDPWTWAVAFSPDSQTVATAHDGGAVKLRDVETGELRLTISGHSTAVRGLAFSPDGKTLATGSDDRTIKLWDVVTGDERVTLRGHNLHIGSLAFSRDGRTLVSGCWDGTVRVWRAAVPESDIDAAPPVRLPANAEP
jgi:WD40 repeat protein/predicted Ser/Thr protein kinase